PEEKFYPVIDGQLDAWQRTDRVEVAELRVVGDRWSRPSYQVRDFLARNHVPYQWMLAEEPEGAQLVAAAGDDCRLPLVVTADGTMLQAPGQSTLAATVGMSTTPATDFYDLIVVAAARPGWARPSTAPPRGCGRCRRGRPRPGSRPPRPPPSTA